LIAPALHPSWESSKVFLESFDKLPWVSWQTIASKMGTDSLLELPLFAMFSVGASMEA